MAKRKATTEEIDTAIFGESQTAEVVEVQTGLNVPEIPKRASLFLVGDQEINKELLYKRIKETKDLVIDGTRDTAGYEAVKKALAEFRTTRTTLEKVRKSNIAPIQEFLKDYKTRTDELGQICAEQEAILAEKIKAVDDEKERIKKEKELEKLRIMQARVQGLLAVGAVTDPENGTYNFPFALQYFTNDLQIQEMDDEEYNEFLADVTECYQLEHVRIWEEKAEKEAEELRIKEQGIAQAAEATRLTEKRTKLRIKELTLMGLEGSEEWGWTQELISREYAPIVLVDIHSVKKYSDEQWEELVEEVQEQIDEANKPKKEVVGMGSPMGINIFSSDKVNMGTPPASSDFYGLNAESGSDVIKAVEADLLVQEHSVAPDVLTETDLLVALKFSEENSFEDLHIAAKFFLRVYPTAHALSALEVSDRIITEGAFKTGDLSWALIKLS